MNVSKTFRKCQDNEENDDKEKAKEKEITEDSVEYRFKIKDINEKNLNTVSDTMCKFFMSGKQRPRDIVRFMEKRKHLLGKSVAKLRKDTFRHQRNTKRQSKRQKFQKLKQERKRKQEKKNNTTNLISRLAQIGGKQQINGTTNASQIIIDSVLSAINTSKQSNINPINNKKNEIKLSVKTSKAFKKKKKKNKKFKNKQKSKKLKAKLKGNDTKKGSTIIHLQVDESKLTK